MSEYYEELAKTISEMLKRDIPVTAKNLECCLAVSVGDLKRRAAPAMYEALEAASRMISMGYSVEDDPMSAGLIKRALKQARGEK